MIIMALILMIMALMIIMALILMIVALMIVMALILMIVTLMIIIALILMIVTLMIIMALILMIASAKGDGVEQISHLQQVDPVCLGCLQHIDESLFQLDSVGHHKVRVVQEGHLGSRCPVVMRIRTHGKQHYQLGIGAHYVRDDVA